MSVLEHMKSPLSIVKLRQSEECRHRDGKREMASTFSHSASSEKNVVTSGAEREEAREEASKEFLVGDLSISTDENRGK